MAGTRSADKLKAFVISPIGEENSPERIHADWVLNSIIRKACERATSGAIALHADRSEHLKLPGDIMEQVVESIIKDRVVFAVLAFDRPNVYYELGLALAAGRRVITLRDRDEKSHFDIKGQRVIGYNIEMRGRELDDKVAEVADYIRTVLAEEPFLADVFKGLNPLGRLAREYQFRASFRDIDIPSYYDMFEEASEFIGLQGITLWHFARADFFWNVELPNRENPLGPRQHASVSFFDIIRSKLLFDAVNVRIVMMHESNAALPHLLKFLDRQPFTKALAATRDEIKRSFDAWSKFREEIEAKAPERKDGRKGTLDVIQLKHGTVNYRLSITDKKVIVSPYFNIFPFNSQGPALIVRSGTAFYDSINREFLDRTVSNQMAIDALEKYGSLEVGIPSETG